MTRAASPVVPLVVPLVLAAALAQPLDAQSRGEPQDWVLGNELIRRGLHEEAAARFESFLAAQPRHERASEARYRLGVCRLETGARDAGIDELQRALRDPRMPYRPECGYRLGGALADAGRPADAAAVLASLAAELDDDHYLAAAVHFGAGEAFLAVGQPREAAPLLREAARLDAEGKADGYAFAGLYRAGHAALETDDPAAAATDFAALLGRFPEHPARGELLWLCGESADRAGQSQAARQAFAAASRIEGEFQDDALVGLAWVSLEAGDRAAAREAFTRLLRDHPDATGGDEARLELGRMDLEAGDAQAARRRFDELLGRDGLDAGLRVDALQLRGLALLAAGDASGAVDDLSRAAAERAGDQRLQYDLGRALVAAGRPEPALQAYVNAAGGSDAALVGDALYGLAVALHDLGRHEESATAAARLVEQWPDHPLADEAAYAVAENLFALERWAAAEAAYRRLAADHPQQARATCRAAWCAFLDGRHAVAAERFEASAAEQRLPAADREESLSMAALARHEAGDPDGALELCDRYKARHRDGAFLGRTERLAARILRGRGDLAGAAQRLAVAERVAGDDEGARLKLERADLLFERGDFRGARELYAALDQATGIERLRALEGVAWCAFELGDDAACLAACRQAEQFASGEGLDATAAPLRAGLDRLALQVHFRAEDWSAADRAAQRFLERWSDDPRAAEVRHARATALTAAGEHRAARRILDGLWSDGSLARSDDLEPAVVVYDAAWARRRDGDEAAALQAFGDLTRMEGADPRLRAEAWLVLGEAAQQRGEGEAARQAFSRVPDDSPLAARARYRTGQSWLAEERFDRAAEAFEAALAGDPELRDDARLALGETLLRAGADGERAARAVTVLEALLRESPQHPRRARAELYLGEALVLAGRPADAVGVLEARLAAAPAAGSDPEADVLAARAALALGRAHAARGQHDRAEQSYRACADRSEGPLGAEALFRIGEAREARGDLKGAAEAFVELTILHDHEPWVPRGLLAAGKAYRGLGQDAKATRMWSELRERYPRSEAARAIPR